MRKFYSLLTLLLAAIMMLSAVSCNKEDADGTDASDAEPTVEQTEAATKKPSRSETEPPVALENTEGLDLSIRVLSQNVGSADRPNGNSVAERTKRFGQLVSEYSPDIIGTQDASFEWVKYMRKIEGYGFVGTSNLGNRSMAGEFNTILYREDRFVLMDSGTFWLSSSPASSSKAMHAISLRTCTWAELFDTYTGRTVIMASADLDHSTEAVRTEQANILVRQLRSKLGDRFTQCQIYLACDLNAVEDDESHTYIYGRAFIDVRDLALEDLSIGMGTYHAYGHIDGGKETSFCFHRGNDTVRSYEIIDKSYGGYVSDHYGILVTFERAE